MLETTLYPLVTQAAITFIVLIVLAKRRLAAYAAGDTKGEYFKLFSGSGGEPPHVQLAQRSFLNQFEMPVLFFVVCLAAQVFGKADTVMVEAAWVYVGLRLIHTVVHLTGNNVLWRFRVFIMSNVALLFMWVWLAL